MADGVCTALQTRNLSEQPADSQARSPPRSPGRAALGPPKIVTAASNHGGAPPAIPGGCANAHGREAAIDEPLFVLQARRDHGTLTVGPFFGEYCRPAVCFSGGHNRECSTVGFRIDLKAADILVRVLPAIHTYPF